MSFPDSATTSEKHQFETHDAKGDRSALQASGQELVAKKVSAAFHHWHASNFSGERGDYAIYRWCLFIRAIRRPRDDD